MPASTPRRRLAVLFALAVVPWTVVLVGDAVTFVFPFGTVTASRSLSFVSLPELLARGGGLPRNPELLPLSVLLYVAALASAALPVVGRSTAPAGDRRATLWSDHPQLTGGLLALAGLTHLGVAWSLFHRPTYLPIPVGALALLAAAWWFYGPSAS